jgi:glycine/D-amino acid oxidase-like deaminating enzyme
LLHTDDGAQVAIVEKRDQPGGNTALSTGSILVPAVAFKKKPTLSIHPMS